MKTSEIEKIRNICKRNDFSYSVSDDFHTFETYTTYGQDWLCEITAEDMDELMERMYDFLDTYDEDYEASLWIGEDGHGKNGAPYHIEDIVADMMDGWHKLDNIYKELKNIDK